jgi:hypothetical protein
MDTPAEPTPPILGEQRYVWDQRGLVELAPQRCPMAGHPLGYRQVAVGWCPGRGLREYTCWACYDTNPAAASWCVTDGQIPSAPTR